MLLFKVFLLTLWCAVTFAADDSCYGKCGAVLDLLMPCQCNDFCESNNDCCKDYAEICQSCADRCGDTYNPYDVCHCNDDCQNYDNCCHDYPENCGGSAGLTDSQLAAFSERILAMDTSGIASMVDIDIQGITSSCSTRDNAEKPLISRFDAKIWDIPTVAAMKKLFDNYNRDVTYNEQFSSEEQSEVDDFHNAIMASPMIRDAYETLNNASLYSGSFEEFGEKMRTLWFAFYDRDGDRSVTTYGSSGFEHVLMGEVKSNSVSGFHNWLYWQYEEERGGLDYLGYISIADFRQNGVKGITNVFDWNGATKCKGGFFIGTLPEVELALYSVCFMARYESDCRLTFNGEQFTITTYNLDFEGQQHIGTAYPQF